MATRDKVERPQSRDVAQQRANQIAAFRAEVAQLRDEGVAGLTGDELARIYTHQDDVLAQLASRFDIDRTAAARRMSRGMQVATLLGGAALVAAIVSFVYRIWGGLGTVAQVALVTAAPIAAVLGMVVAGRLERTRYVASLFATVAGAAFVLQTVMLAQVFNLRGAPHAVAAWGVFSLAVGWPWRFGLPVAAGAVLLAVYVPALLLWLNGISWFSFPERPELLMLSAGAALLAFARAPRDVARWVRSALLVLGLGALLALTFGTGSLLSNNTTIVEAVYQFVAAAVTMALIWTGLRRGMQDVVVIGALFGGIFLLTRFVDWWWDWMPKYLFFLIIAAVALGWLWGLRIARRRVAGGPA